VYAAGERGRVGENRIIDGLGSGAARDFLGDQAPAFGEEIELVKGATQRSGERHWGADNVGS